MIDGDCLPEGVQIVHLDVRKVRWCTVGSVAFQGFAWPHVAREAESIMRTLFNNLCQWADVLIVRGRCFGWQRSRFAANRVLENLLWHWSKTSIPFAVYQEGG